MPTITRIQPQIDKNRVKVFVDGRYTLDLPLETHLKYNLTLNKELSFGLIKILNDEGIEERIYVRAIDYLTKMPRSEKEMWAWFERKKIPLETAEVVFNRLKHLNLIDDLAFGKWWIEQRLTFKPKSRRFVQHELRVKGIKHETISKLLDGWNRENEINISYSIAEKKLKKLTDLPKDQKRKKLVEFLRRRGFFYGEIRKVVDQLLEK